MTERLVRWGAARMSRRMARTLPWVGAIIGVATVGAAMRRKGVLGGALDTGLNAVPFLGSAKNAIELVRGRDFIPDRQLAT